MMKIDETEYKIIKIEQNYFQVKYKDKYFDFNLEHGYQYDEIDSFLKVYFQTFEKNFLLENKKKYFDKFADMKEYAKYYINEDYDQNNISRSSKIFLEKVNKNFIKKIIEVANCKTIDDLDNIHFCLIDD